MGFAVLRSVMPRIAAIFVASVALAVRNERPAWVPKISLVVAH
jgi:hypothetical protein